MLHEGTVYDIRKKDELINLEIKKLQESDDFMNLPESVRKQIIGTPE